MQRFFKESLNFYQMKYKILLLLALTVIFASKCTEEEVVPIVYFDHVTQAQKDNDSLVKFFQTNYLDSNGEIKKIDAAQAPIWGSNVLKDTIVKHKWDYTDDAHDVEIDYKLYYIKVLDNGIEEMRPTVVDSAFISYKGALLNGTVFDENPYGFWMTLLNVNVRKGMYNGWVHFKPGNLIVNADQTFSFENQGKGILIMPSGLAYANESRTKIPENSPLVFYINLNMVNRTDWDSDGIDSIYEDLNHNRIFTDDDTDGDTKQNYYDADDDGDGVLTKDEHPDPNGDHNPNDAQMTMGTLADYLNPAVK